LPESLVRARLRERGHRWTPQRRVLIDVLSAVDGHVTGAELVERCRAVDPRTIPSTVYRTLDVLEELGFVRHTHGAAGREEYHVLPESQHAHLYCERCGETWDIPASDAASLVEDLDRAHGFLLDVPHVTLSGVCAACRRPARQGIEHLV
jgi:Fur family ferric uptake transcriptional regulator